MNLSSTLLNIPPEFFTIANCNIIKMLSVIRSIGFKNCRHQLGKPFANCGSCLWLNVISGSSEIEASRNEGLMLKEPIVVISILEFDFSVKRKEIKNIK